MRGLYIHIPFCVRKCAYCDFYSVPERRDSITAYIDAVLSEAAVYAKMSFRTLYLGGGTPSLLGTDNLKKLVNGLRRTFDLSGLAEATIEVNPDSATHELLETAKETGINRLSIGVQSLSDHELKSVGRVHNSAQAIEAICRARELGFDSVSCDVIAGLPGQTWETLKTTLEIPIKLGIQHLSMYCLSLEEGTPLAQNPPADLPTDDEQAELFDRATTFLKENGFNHYEISNFALDGYECRHNLNYWRGGEYLGLGASAASHLKGKRFKNLADLDAYLKNPTGSVSDIEELGRREKSAEEAMLRLRLLLEGLDVIELVRRFGDAGGLTSRLQAMSEQGLLVRQGTVYRLPSSRVLTSNPVFAGVLGD